MVGPVRFDVSIVSTAHDVADARLHRQVAALVRAGLRVEVLALGDPAGGPPGVQVTVAPRTGLAGRVSRAALLPWQAKGSVVIVFDPDLVPAARLLRLRRRAVVVDVHEDYAALLTDRAWAWGLVGLVARTLVAAATKLASGADLTVVADEHVPPANAAQRMVLRNLPDTDMLPKQDPVRDLPLRALYVGDLRTSRGLFAMLEMIEAAPDWTLDLVGPVAPADQSALNAWLAGSLAADRIRLHGRLAPRQAWGLAAGASAGLLLLEPTPAFVSAVPSKLYEYLACGLAVLSTPLPRSAEVLLDAGAGTTAERPDELAAILTYWARNPATLGELQRRAVDWAAENLSGHPYDDFAARVAALVGR